MNRPQSPSRAVAPPPSLLRSYPLRLVPRMTERLSVNKPSRSFAKPLRDLLGKVVGETFTRQGFASAELVTRWTEIVGAEIAAHSEPIKIQWPRASPSLPSPASGGVSGWGRPPGTLVLRVEGPACDRNPAPRQRDLRARQPLRRLARHRTCRAAPSPAAAGPPQVQRSPRCRGGGAHCRRHAGDSRREFTAGARPARRGSQTALSL